MWSLLSAGLHSLAPERAHAVALASLRAAPVLYDAERIGAEHEVLGLRFPNRVGLAAGFDKDGDHLTALAKLGFGFIEIGTITPRAQPGSPKPRLFRLPKAGALINRMGFNNRGVEHAARQLAAQRVGFSGVLGCNIGRNRDTPADKAKEDYLTCLRKLYGLADYFTVNVSSPNTPGLRDLQAPARLHDLLASLVELREQLATNHKQRAPLLVKVSPDLAEADIADMARVIEKVGVDGVIATNTTVDRPAEISRLPYGGQPGGLSGGPLRDKASAALRLWRAALPGSMAVIAVGGIASAADAKERLADGADLLQLYTGLVYRGPGLVAECAAATR